MKKDGWTHEQTTSPFWGSVVVREFMDMIFNTLKVLVLILAILMFTW